MTQIEELFPNIDKLSVVLRKSLHTALSGGYKRTDYEKAFERLFKLLLEAEEFIETEDDKEHWDSEAQAVVFYYFAAMERELISVPEYSELDLLCAEFIDKVELPESIAKKLVFGTLGDFLEKNPMPVISDYLARVNHLR